MITIKIEVSTDSLYKHEGHKVILKTYECEFPNHGENEAYIAVDELLIDDTESFLMGVTLKPEIMEKS